MRIYDIMLFVLIFNVVTALISTAAVFETSSPIQADTQMIEEFHPFGSAYNITQTERAPVESGEQNAYLSLISATIMGFNLFISVVFKATFGVYWSIYDLTGQFDGGATALYLSVIIYFIYIVGIVQFISGRSFKPMQ